jgi:glycosyltransferase involved in cell wall biosynthesis
MSDPTHTITLYMPSYNQAPLIPLAIESVLAQTRRPDQFIIIDDASSDESPEIIRDYQRRHPELIHAVLNTENIGIGAVRHKAISLAKGDLVTYLDGDDLYEPQKLELEERALIEHPEAGYAYSNVGFIDQHGNDTGVWYPESEPLPQGDLFSTIARYAFARGICHRCELMRTSIVRDAGSYEPGMNLYEDYNLKLRVSRHHPGVAIDRVTQRYRIHEGGLHRASYARHFDALSHIYNKNESLIDSLDEPERTKVRATINSTLASCAWRAVNQAAKGQHPLPKQDVKRYARHAYRLKPKSYLQPKHAYRVLRALSRAKAKS